MTETIMKKHVDEASSILIENIYCSLGTASLEHTPWVSPVYYSLDSDCRIYWASSVSARHSDNVSKNSQAFISIFDSTALPRQASGVYFLGDVAIMQNSNIDHIVYRHFQRVNEPNKLTGADYLNKSPERIYEFSPKKAWILGKPNAVNGHLIDQKFELSIEELKATLKTIEDSKPNKWLQPSNYCGDT